MSGNAVSQFSGSAGVNSTMDLSIFGPDAVTPEQFFAHMGGHGADSAEKRLIREILMDAIRCVQGCATSYADHDKGKVVETRKIRLRADALEWIAGADAYLTFDFCCEVLDINPEWLRQGLRVMPAGTKIAHFRHVIEGNEKIVAGYRRRDNYHAGRAHKRKKMTAEVQ